MLGAKLRCWQWCIIAALPSADRPDEAGYTQLHVGHVTKLPPAQAGQIKILGIGSEKRLAKVPEIPTVKETGLPATRRLAGLVGLPWLARRATW